MKSDFLKSKLALVAITVVSLMTTGCSFVGGFNASDNKIAVDDQSVSLQLKDALRRAKKLSILGPDSAAVHMAEYLEAKGAYTVALEEIPKRTTLSQRQQIMQKTCGGAEKPDLVLAAVSSDTNVGGSTTVRAIFTGRVNYDVDYVFNFMHCRERWQQQMNVKLSMSQGVYNADHLRAAKEVGELAAKELIRVAGK